MRKFEPLPVVAIIGGGFSGAAVALHLARRQEPEPGAGIVVFEPRARLGAGLAYDTTEPTNRINVPAGRMSLYPDAPESFVDYLERVDALAGDTGAMTADGVPYPRRSVFGDYVASELAPYLSSGAIEHRRALVLGIRRSAGRWTISSSDDQELVADIVVIAVSHPAPALPKALLPVLSHPKLVSDPTKAGAFEVIASADRVLIVGNGLTSADVVAALGGRGPLRPDHFHLASRLALPRPSRRRAGSIWRLRLRTDHPRLRASPPHPPGVARGAATGAGLASSPRCREGARPADLASTTCRRTPAHRPTCAALLGRSPLPHSATGRNGARSSGGKRHVRHSRGLHCIRVD
ncbi:putative NAD(P)/FAD-binding protein YdhS [Sinorhizobium fredii]